MRHKVEFAYDEPAFDPREICHVFSAEEGTFYLSDTAGGLLNARLRSRGIGAGDAITITKVRVPNPNSKRPITEYVPRLEVE
jgi:hypothetical protein